MNEWREVALGDIGRIVTGTTPPAKNRSWFGDRFEFITPSDIDASSRRATPTRWLSDEGAAKLASRLLPADSVCFVCIGATIGKLCMTYAPSFTNQQINAVVVNRENDPRFVYYLLRCEAERIAAAASGAATPIIKKSSFAATRVRILPPRTQTLVGAILGTIDDLIENNRQRIALLEQMAQAIYREWFVHFRYPGREDDELVDSPLGPIPNGWRIVPFSELADFLNGFAFKPTHWGSVGLPIVKIRELKQGVTASTPRYDGDDIAPRYRIETGDLLFSWSAHLEAYLWSGAPALFNQHLFKVSPVPGVTKGWLFFALRGEIDHFRSRSQGTTMKHIKRAALGEVSTVTPTTRVMETFSDVVGPVLDELLALSRLVGPLEAMRDVLLPKLVTGTIDVSKLDLDALLEKPAT